jgi:anti-sigma factor (TIGR02949 family)
MRSEDLDDPLSCAAALELIEPFLDGDLDAGDAERLRGHLAGCAACAAERALAERVHGELRALPQPECPPELLARVVRTGRGEVVPFRPRRTERLRIAAAAAVLALAVGGGSLFVHLQQVQQQREQVAEATREARLALAYFGKVTRKAGLDVRDEVLRRRRKEL